MTAQEILQLMQGGFTHDEIIALTQETPVPAPVPVPGPAPDPEPTPAPVDEPSAVPAADPAPEPSPAAAPGPDQIAQLLKANADLQLQVAHLTSTLQANAVANSMIPGGVPQKPDASQVLGQIIRPTRSKKEA